MGREKSKNYDIGKISPIISTLKKYISCQENNLQQIGENCLSIAVHQHQLQSSVSIITERLRKFTNLH